MVSGAKSFDHARDVAAMWCLCSRLVCWSCPLTGIKLMCPVSDALAHWCLEYCSGVNRMKQNDRFRRDSDFETNHFYCYSACEPIILNVACDFSGMSRSADSNSQRETALEFSRNMIQYRQNVTHISRI